MFFHLGMRLFQYAVHQMQARIGQALDQPFIVGGSKLMFPGDNSLGAAANEIIQCRCTQYYERVKDAEPVEDDTKVGKALRLYVQSLPSVNITREQYRGMLRMKS